MTTHMLHSLKQSSRDIRLLWFSVFIRMISFGLTNQILTLYLKELDISESKIGIFMSLTMIGDSAISYFLTWNANKIGNKVIMLLGSLLMIIASIIFATGTSNYQYLLFAAIIGVISPSGNDTGPFKIIEETVLAHLTPPNHRPEIYAIHNVLGSIGGSLGSFLAGFLINYFIKNLNVSIKVAYGYTFYVLVFTSSLKFISLLFISPKVEASYVPEYKILQRQISYDSINDSTLDSADITVNSTNSERHQPISRIESTVEHTTITGLSPKTQMVLFKLMVPFMLDSFGYGFMPNAWIVYYFKRRYETSSIILGTLFGFSGIAMSLSSIPSAWFAKKSGPIKASILTQIPCGLFFICIPLLGFNFGLASFFYLLNQMTTAFDVVPRQIILTTLVEPLELSKVMGTVNIGKQVARSVSPYITGYLAEFGLLWVCFLISAILLIIANLLLAFGFSDLDEKVRKLEQVRHNIV